MRLVLSLVGLALSLAACELPRPEGAYFSPDAAARPDAGKPSLDKLPDAAVMVFVPIAGGSGGTMGGVPGGMQAGMPGGTGGLPDGGGAGGTAGGGIPGGEIDAGAQLTPEQQALRKLAGRYLMRMDMLSTAAIRASALISVEMRNRISHLIATELVVTPDGQLKGYERLCYQTFAHRCTRNCQTMTTVMSPAVKNQLVMSPPTERSYLVNGRMLKGLANTMALGFTDTNVPPRMPTASGDMRVWDTLPGGAREGLLLVLDLAAARNVRCDVYTVQNFASTFEGLLAGSALDPSLVLPSGGFYTLSSMGSDGLTLGSDSADCSGAEEGAPPMTVGENVRFAALAEGEFPGDSFWACPEQSVWDTRLAPPAP